MRVALLGRQPSFFFGRVSLLCSPLERCPTLEPAWRREFEARLSSCMRRGNAAVLRHHSNSHQRGNIDCDVCALLHRVPADKRMLSRWRGRGQLGAMIGTRAVRLLHGLLLRHTKLGREQSFPSPSRCSLGHFSASHGPPVPGSEKGRGRGPIRWLHWWLPLKSSRKPRGRAGSVVQPSPVTTSRRSKGMIRHIRYPCLAQIIGTPARGPSGSLGHVDSLSCDYPPRGRTKP